MTASTIHLKCIYILFVTFKTGLWLLYRNPEPDPLLLTRRNLGQDPRRPFQSWLSRLQQKCNHVSVVSSPALQKHNLCAVLWFPKAQMSTISNLFVFIVDYCWWSPADSDSSVLIWCPPDLLSSLYRKGSFLFFWPFGLEKEKHKRTLDTGAKSCTRSMTGWQCINLNSHTPQTTWWCI